VLVRSIRSRIARPTRRTDTRDRFPGNSAHNRLRAAATAASTSGFRLATGVKVVSSRTARFQTWWIQRRWLARALVMASGCAARICCQAVSAVWPALSSAAVAIAS